MLYRTHSQILLLLLFACPSFSQVRMNLAKDSFKPEERIEVEVLNVGTATVTYCVEFGQSSPIRDTRESTPIPFYLERHTKGKWDVPLIGPDVGSARLSDELEPGRSQHFPFRLLEKGEMRLVLHYWIGERDDACSNPSTGRRTAKSRLFSVAGD